MGRERKRCTRCILPENYPGIEFDEAGICNYCYIHKKTKHRGDELNGLLESFRNKGGKYDCIVGVSGGRDSSYALHYLVKVCKLRTLAYTADHGFIPEATKINMKNMADRLGVELITEQTGFLRKCIKTNISAWLRKPSPQMVQIICCGCRLGIARGLFKCARENNIPLIVVGGGASVEMCYFKRAYFGTNLFGKKNESLLMLLGLSYEMIKNPYYLTPTTMSVFGAEFLYYFTAGIRGLFYPDQKVIYLYRYIEWDEGEILSTIRNELDWVQNVDSASTWRSDCKINFLRNYLLKESFGLTEKEDNLSNMVRENMITREEALERLKNEVTIPQKLISEVLEEIGLNPSAISGAVRMVRRNAPRKE